MWLQVKGVFILIAVCMGQQTKNYRLYDVEKIKTDQGYKVNKLAVNEKYVVIGSPYDGQTGSVAVYENKPGYKLIKRLVPNDLTKRCLYGYSVAINDDYIVVGAKWSKGKHKRQGAVYVFEVNGWEYQKLEANFPGKKHGFGYSVAINKNNELVVGAPKSTARVNKTDFGIGFRAGAAYLFALDSTGKWILKQTLIPEGLQAYDYMGRSLAITNDYLAVSADPPEPTTEPGTVYVFKKNVSGSWEEDAKLGSPNAEESGGFGSAIAIYDNRILIGASSESKFTGNVYVFVISNGKWTLESQLASSEKHSTRHDGFGTSVAFNGNEAVVGTAFYDGRMKDFRAHGHVFELANGRWNVGKALDLTKEGYIESLVLLNGKIYAGAGDGSYVFTHALTAGLVGPDS